MGHLRAIRDDELDMMLGWRNAPSVRQHMYNQEEIPRQTHLAWWERIRNREDYQYFIYENEGTPRGIVAFTAINRAQSNSAWAFYADPDAPKGTGSQMEFAALEHAFNVLGLHKLHCEVLSSNTAVIRLHEKFGFQVEGVLREEFFLDNKFIDIVRLGILHCEWQDARSRFQSVQLRKTGDI